MFTRRHVFYAGAAGLGLAVFRLARPHAATAATRRYEVTHTDEEWRKLLTPAQYSVLRQDGTELPFTSPLLEEHRAGTFSLRRLRPAAVLLEDEIRKRHRLAELLGAACQCRGRNRGPLVRHDPHGGLVPPLRRPSRPRLQRWAEADRAALLHERRGAEIHAGAGGIELLARTR